jgi:hypothetical protein
MSPEIAEFRALRQLRPFDPILAQVVDSFEGDTHNRRGQGSLPIFSFGYTASRML